MGRSFDPQWKGQDRETDRSRRTETPVTNLSLHVLSIKDQAFVATESDTFLQKLHSWLLFRWKGEIAKDFGTALDLSLSITNNSDHRHVDISSSLTIHIQEKSLSSVPRHRIAQVSLRRYYAAPSRDKRGDEMEWFFTKKTFELCRCILYCIILNPFLLLFQPFYPSSLARKNFARLASFVGSLRGNHRDPDSSKKLLFWDGCPTDWPCIMSDWRKHGSIHLKHKKMRKKQVGSNHWIHMKTRWWFQSIWRKKDC